MSDPKEIEFDEFLDELFPPYQIGGFTFYASEVLKTLDPIAYRISFSEYENDND
jgi:hypothetical protein